MNTNDNRTVAGDWPRMTFDDIIGSTPSFMACVDAARKFACTPENILLTGQSGTGKECFAQAIHNGSRRGKPFMSINCAAIPPRLIESELFGYEGGSFTGAQRSGQPGKIELTNGGTLFLDEIGDMPLELQATLLRVLENKRVMRIGGKQYKPIDFRLVTATNQDLEAQVASGRFRADLFYRLSVLVIALPALRERRADIAAFARRFLDECRRHNPTGPTGFTPAALAALEASPWPGNVRQLKNTVFRAFYMAAGTSIDVDDLPCASATTASSQRAAWLPARPAPNKLPTLAAIEQAAIKQALALCNGNASAAARMLGIGRATLYRKLQENQAGTG